MTRKGSLMILPPQELKAWHRPRVSELVSCGVDMLACETLPAQLEAEALVELLHDEFPTTQAWISFSCKVESTRFNPVL